MNKIYEVKNLSTFELDKGNLFKGLSINDNNYYGFGEIYFTSILPSIVKGWKKHIKMTLNIIVLNGAVKFVIINKLNINKNTYIDIELSENKKQILTIFPNNWFAFQGLNEKLSLLTNISNIPHDDNEVENTNLETFDYNWEIM